MLLKIFNRLLAQFFFFNVVQHCLLATLPQYAALLGAFAPFL